MSYLHASGPRAVGDGGVGGRTGVAVIESSASRKAAQPKKKYRDPLLDSSESTTVHVKPNIMFDPRVARGSTAGKTAILSSTASAEQLASTLPRYDTEAASAAASSAAAAAGARAKKAALLATGAIRPKHHSAAYIHSHITVTKKRIDVPLHLYLVEQKESPLVHTLPTQTDEWMEEAPAPSYVPRKQGRDIASQVENEMVFNFDRDIASILEVVVSKTVEQGLMEVREEEELSAIDSHAQSLRAKFAAEESGEDQRLREERALFQAKEKMLAEARRAHAHILSVRAKLAAHFFSRHYLANLKAHVMDSLARDGFFAARDSVSQQLEASYLPSLLVQTDANLSAVTAAKAQVHKMVGEALEREGEAKRILLENRAAAAAKAAAEKAASDAAAAELARRQRKIQLFIHSDALPAEQNPVGPITLTGESSLADVEAKVYRWMELHLAEEQGLDIPPRQFLRFLWNGQTLDVTSTSTAIYDLGIQNLATLSMELHLPPEPEKKKRKGKKGKKKKKQRSEEEDGENEEEGEDAEDGEDGEDDEDEEGEDGEDDEDEDEDAEDGSDKEGKEDAGEEEEEEDEDAV